MILFQGTIGKSFKKDAKMIMDALSAMSLEDISKKEKDSESSEQVIFGKMLTFDILLLLNLGDS